MYTYASKLQFGAVVIYKDKPIDFYSRKLTDTQKSYKITEKELLCIIKTLK